MIPFKVLPRFSPLRLTLEPFQVRDLIEALFSDKLNIKLKLRLTPFLEVLERSYSKRPNAAKAAGGLCPPNDKVDIVIAVRTLMQDIYWALEESGVEEMDIHFLRYILRGHLSSNAVNVPEWRDEFEITTYSKDVTC